MFQINSIFYRESADIRHVAAFCDRCVFSHPPCPVSRGDLGLQVDWGWARGQPGGGGGAGILGATKVFAGRSYSGMNIFCFNDLYRH